MKLFKTFLLSTVLLLFGLINTSYSQGLYLSVGGDYFIPTVNFDKYTENSPGVNIEIIGKRYCKLWYGLRFDYIQLQQKSNSEGLEFTDNYSLSPVVKFAPFTSDCYDNKLIPYLTGMLNIGMIEGNDDVETGMGLGVTGGIGLAYNFKLFGRCMMLEAEGNYACPNAILRDKKRNTMQSFNVGLNLSVAL